MARLTERKLLAAADRLDRAALDCLRVVSMLRDVTANPRSRQVTIARVLAVHRDRLQQARTDLGRHELRLREGQLTMLEADAVSADLERIGGALVGAGEALRRVAVRPEVRG